MPAHRGRAAPGTPVRLAPGAEFDLIRSFYPREEEYDASVVLGPGDDCAVVGAAGLAVSVDLSVEGVHFLRHWLSPGEIGYRASAAAFSDLAAVGARPIGALVALALPEPDAGEFATALMQGTREAAGTLGAAILGGDVSRTSGPLVIDVCVLGEARAPIPRSGARPGDAVWVTGSLGAASFAVSRWLSGDEPDPQSRARFASPIPRVVEARWLNERGLVRAAIDLSDGLAGDAAHLARASQVRVILEEDALPTDTVVRGAVGEREALRFALAGGEDYELCIAARAGALDAQAGGFERELGVALTRIGRVEQGEGVWLQRADGALEPLGERGYQHFGGVG